MNYLYNGVGPLPDIYSVYTPEVQKSHPFALIKTGIFNSGYMLYLFGKDAYYYDNNGSWFFGGNSDNPVPGYSSTYDESSGTWGELVHHDTWNVNVGGLTATLGDILWANFDVLKKDGTLYLAASDPVPVSPDQNDPALLQRAFWKGFAAGIPG